MPLLHLSLWLLIDVCCTDKDSHPQSQAVAGGDLRIYNKVYQQCWKEWTGWCAQKGVPINAISASELADF